MSVILKQVKEIALRTSIFKAAKKIQLVLRDKQFEAIYQFYYGNDVFVSLPTGLYGKSIIYGILPLVFDDLRRKFFQECKLHVLCTLGFIVKMSLFWYIRIYCTISPITIIIIIIITSLRTT